MIVPATGTAAILPSPTDGVAGDHTILSRNGRQVTRSRLAKIGLEFRVRGTPRQAGMG